MARQTDKANPSRVLALYVPDTVVRLAGAAAQASSALAVLTITPAASGSGGSPIVILIQS